MLAKNILLAVLTAVSAVNAQEYLGFNYGASKTSGQVKVESDFQEEFALAKKLAGTSGKFSSARLYTMIQGPSKDDPISAIQAAIDTQTTLLLGIWCSAGQELVTNEIAALVKAIKQYGEDFTKLVVGLSIGSEDLYRNSPMGIENKSGLGAHPEELVKYIGQVKQAISGTSLANVPLGHVDTWTAWVNGSNSAVVDALDWLGFDAYPYFQSTMANPIEAANELFWQAYDNTKSAAKGKEVWITETGWPVSGKDSNLAKAGVEPAQEYWNTVGCQLFGNYKTWWYLLRDADPTAPATEFGVLDANLKPYYDLSCKNAKPVSRSSSSASAPASTGAATRTAGTTFSVTNPTASNAPAATTTGADSPSAAFSLKAAMGIVALQVAVAAFFVL